MMPRWCVKNKQRELPNQDCGKWFFFPCSYEKKEKKFLDGSDGKAHMSWYRFLTLVLIFQWKHAFSFFFIQQWHQLSTGCTGNLSDLKQIFYVHKFYVLGKVSHDRNVMTQGGIHPEWWDLGRGTRVVCVIVSTKSVSACQPPLVFKQKPGQEHYGQSQVYRQLAGKTQQHSVHFICCSTLGFFFPWTYKHTNTWCVCDVGVAALPPGVCERPGSSATCTFAAYSGTFNLMRPCTAWFVYSKIHVVADESSVSLEIT